MKVLLLPLMLMSVGCRREPSNVPDASVAVDARTIDAGADFFGEPCSPSSTPFLTVVCRQDATWPHKGYCTPAGICRPFCAYETNGIRYEICRQLGGVETWTGSGGIPGGDRGVCYCDPP